MNLDSIQYPIPIRGGAPKSSYWPCYGPIQYPIPTQATPISEDIFVERHTCLKILDPIQYPIPILEVWGQNQYTFQDNT